MKTAWDKHVRYPGDPWDAYAAWERWMAERDEKTPDTETPILEAVPGYYMWIELYARFCDAAYGTDIPYLRRLFDVLAEPWVKAYWRARNPWPKAGSNAGWFRRRTVRGHASRS